VVDRGDDDRAAASSRAEPVELVEHVKLTAEVAVVDGQTAAEPHAPEVRRLHHDHLVRRRTAGDERLRLAVLRHHACPPAIIIVVIIIINITITTIIITIIIIIIIIIIKQVV